MIWGYTDRRGKPIRGWSRQCYQSPGQPTAPHLQMGRRRGVGAARRATALCTLAPLQAGPRPLAGNATRAARRRPPRRGRAAPLARGTWPSMVRVQRLLHGCTAGRTVRHAAAARSDQHRQPLGPTAPATHKTMHHGRERRLVFIGPKAQGAMAAAPCLLRRPAELLLLAGRQRTQAKRRDARGPAETPRPAVAARPPQATPKASAQGPVHPNGLCQGRTSVPAMQADLKGACPSTTHQFQPIVRVVPRWSLEPIATRSRNRDPQTTRRPGGRTGGTRAQQGGRDPNLRRARPQAGVADHQGDRLLNQVRVASRTPLTADRLQGFITCSQRRSGWPGTLIDRSERYSCCSSSAISLNNAPEDLQLIQYDTADFASLPALDRTSNEPLGTLVQETHIAAFHASCEQHAICTLYQIRKLLFGPLHNGIAEFLGCPRHSARSKS